MYSILLKIQFKILIVLAINVVNLLFLKMEKSIFCLKKTG